MRSKRRHSAGEIALGSAPRAETSSTSSGSRCSSMTLGRGDELAAQREQRARAPVRRARKRRPQDARTPDRPRGRRVVARSPGSRSPRPWRGRATPGAAAAPASAAATPRIPRPADPAARRRAGRAAPSTARAPSASGIAVRPRRARAVEPLDVEVDAQYQRQRDEPRRGQRGPSGAEGNARSPRSRPDPTPSRDTGRTPSRDRTAAPTGRRHCRAPSSPG